MVSRRKGSGKNEMRIFGLDRIDNLEASSRRALIPKDFSIHKYFKHSIGISVDSEDISEFVELTFSPKLAGYIKTFLFTLASLFYRIRMKEY